MRSVRVDHTGEDRHGHGMLLPVFDTARNGPSGPIERNGQEI